MLHRRKGWAKCGAAWVDHGSGSISMSSLSSACILSPFLRTQKVNKGRNSGISGLLFLANLAFLGLTGDFF